MQHLPCHQISSTTRNQSLVLRPVPVPVPVRVPVAVPVSVLVGSASGLRPDHTRMEAAIVWLSTLSFWNKNLIENFYFVCKVMLTCNSASARVRARASLMN